jgi:hypothetical protein
MYLIIKKTTYGHDIEPSFNVVGTSDYKEGAHELLDAHETINNKNKNVSFKIVNFDEPLLLTKEMEVKPNGHRSA